MEKETSGDTSGSDAAGNGRAAQDSAQSVSGLTEAGTSSNAGEKAWHRHGVAGGEDDDGLLAVVEKSVGDGSDVEWEVTKADGEDDDEVGAFSPVRRAAARLGWLLLGFLAGGALAAAVLFLMRYESPVTCTVVPT